ncbi:MAG: 2,3-bisphosphoglycerate-independent phosphoglycerate mutase [Rhodospirillaceae bacterium]|jgi:2,3-bisphosphoglycerate-independent phosphoglycerate mutase|nr:2,3-bisphosphoglycerate-independent phosphoglycerate mutase [Rhodospirillaceae bacterium]
MAFQPARRPVVLCVLDGWGWSDNKTDNAIALAETPVYDRLLAQYPNSRLKTSGIDVGLPAGQMGNSEVGHLNLGAGRVVDQDIRRVDAAMEDGTLGANPALVGLIDTLKGSGGTCHLMALISPGGVHSHQGQVAALAKALDEAGIPVAIHAFLDGRDTPPRSADGFMKEFQAALATTKNTRIATVTGRFYAMDRDQRWDRVGQAYNALVSAQGEPADDAMSAITASYENDTGDEFVLPTIIGDYAGMKDGDGLLMGNFRADRAREILTALLSDDFDGFPRDEPVAFACATGLVEYSETLGALMSTLFPPIPLAAIMGDLVAEAGLKQLRIAETEKYAHVTFFFNGGVETPFPGEDRILVPSPKVTTYDLQPEMSAAEVTDKLVAAIVSGAYDFIFVNYANPDMVGHTGMLDAAMKAIATVDQCLGRLEEAVVKAGGSLLITADHGNAETMTDPDTGAPFTSHTVNVVPAILVNGPAGMDTLENGRLSDVAPTLLQLIGLPKSSHMTGNSLLASPTNANDGTSRDSVPASA